MATEYGTKGGFGGYLGTSGTRGPWDVIGLRRQHNAWLGAHERMILDQANQLGDDSIAAARAQKKVKNRTGALAAGWKKQIRRSPSKVSVALISRVKHAFFQELGTGLWGPSGNPIVPRRHPYLHFKTADGKWVRTKSVRGVPPKFIGKHAVFGVWGLGKAKFKRAATRLAKRF